MPSHTTETTSEELAGTATIVPPTCAGLPPRIDVTRRPTALFAFVTATPVTRPKRVVLTRSPNAKGFAGSTKDVFGARAKIVAPVIEVIGRGARAPSHAVSPTLVASSISRTRVARNAKDAGTNGSRPKARSAATMALPPQSSLVIPVAAASSASAKRARRSGSAATRAATRALISIIGDSTGTKISRYWRAVDRSRTSSISGSWRPQRVHEAPGKMPGAPEQSAEAHFHICI